VCKHVHAAHLFNNIKNNKTTLDIVKNELVQYFHNKEHVMPKEQKNLTIYSSSTNAAFEEILQTYSTEGNNIFFYMINYLDNSNDNEMPLDSELEASVIFESNEVSTDSLNEQSSLLAPLIQK
ncbi:6394_t:CDS:2, partial [Cetraspora pellucida]